MRSSTEDADWMNVGARSLVPVHQRTVEWGVAWRELQKKSCVLCFWVQDGPEAGCRKSGVSPKTLNLVLFVSFVLYLFLKKSNLCN